MKCGYRYGHEYDLTWSRALDIDMTPIIISKTSISGHSWAPGPAQLFYRAIRSMGLKPQPEVGWAWIWALPNSNYISRVFIELSHSMNANHKKLLTWTKGAWFDDLTIYQSAPKSFTINRRSWSAIYLRFSQRRFDPIQAESGQAEACPGLAH